MVEKERTGDYVQNKAVCVCDSCGLEVHGYEAHELMQAPHGWVWHPIPFREKQYFVMCGECEKEYAHRRAVSQPWKAPG
jgi:transcription elongation factor Elf1